MTTQTPQLVSDEHLDKDEAFDKFAEWVSTTRGFDLYPAQEEALLEVAAGSNVFLATPTGSGKSLVAYGAIFSAITSGGAAVYTAPIKALVSEKFFELVDIFGADKVGMVTGDASVNSHAPIICCTAEILANSSLTQGADDDRLVVMDEFHYYADPERGWAWQVPLLLMPKAQFVMMSATLGKVDTIATDLQQRTGRDSARILGTERPVPLEFKYEVANLHEAVTELIKSGQTPVYLVHFSQAEAVKSAQALTSLGLIEKDRRKAIAEAIRGVKFNTAFGGTLKRILTAGIGIHHAGMLPRYRRLVEQLAQQGLLTVISGTDTLGVGINIPIRTVVFTGLVKFDGSRMRKLKSREFHQIAGRAGRAGFDTIGTVVALAPEHEIAARMAELKALKTGKKVKHKKQQQGVSWDKNTFQRLIDSSPEELTSRMQISHQMVLGALSHGSTALATMETLVFGNHEPRAKQFRLARRALGIYRTLRAAGIVQVSGGVPELTIDLPEGFALNQPLSPFAIAAMELLDPDSDSFTLDVISLVEATLDNPGAILRAQEHKARGEAIGQMKADGVEYEERMERVEEITYPQPLAELVGEAFDSYAAEVPWARDFEPQPKSIVRDMIEHGLNFRSLVTEYDLARAEGGVLRYLSDAWRALHSTVPESVRTPQFEDILAWLREVVRGVDSTMMDEWAALSDTASQPSSDDEIAALAPPHPLGFTGIAANSRALQVAIRNAMFLRVQLMALERSASLGDLDADCGWNKNKWDAALDAYFAEYDEIRVDQAARNPRLCEIDATDPRLWKVRQVILDPSDDLDWAISATVDLPATDELGEPVITITEVGALTS